MREDQPYAKLVKHRDDCGDRMWLWRGCAVVVGRGRWVCRHLHASASDAIDCADARLARVAEGC